MRRENLDPGLTAVANRIADLLDAAATSTGGLTKEGQP
jgi:hypothetical protein